MGASPRWIATVVEGADGAPLFEAHDPDLCDPVMVELMVEQLEQPQRVGVGGSDAEAIHDGWVDVDRGEAGHFRSACARLPAVHVFDAPGPARLQVGRRVRPPRGVERLAGVCGRGRRSARPRGTAPLRGARPPGPGRSRPGRRGVLRRAVRALAAEGSYAGPTGAGAEWATWLAFEHADLHAWYAAMARRRGVDTAYGGGGG